MGHTSDSRFSSSGTNQGFVDNPNAMSVRVRTVLLVASLATCVAMPASAEVYQWRDATGRLHFGDDPPEGADARKVDIDTRRQNVYAPPGGASTPQRGAGEQHTPKRDAPDLDALLRIRLPPDASKRQVREYVHRILAASRNQRSYLASDPQVGMLMEVGPQNVDVLIEVARDGVPWARYAVEAIKSLATEAHKPAILAALPQQKRLSAVVYSKGWSEDAREILLQGMRNYSGYLPSEWLRAVASFRDPGTYDLLKAYMINGWNRHSTYRIIRTLPGIDLWRALPQAWENARTSGRKYEVADLTADTVGTGYMPALRFVVGTLDGNHGLSPGTYKPREIVERYLEIDGDNTTIRDWFEAHHDELVFDRRTGKYRLKTADAKVPVLKSE